MAVTLGNTSLVWRDTGKPVEPHDLVPGIAIAVDERGRCERTPRTPAMEEKERPRR